MNSNFSFLALVCFLQSCITTPNGNAASTQSIDSLIVTEIDEIRTNLKGIPAIKISKSSDNLVETLKKFRKNTPENKKIRAVWNLIGKALEGPVCDTKEINLKQMLNKSGNESNEGGITVEKMKEVQQQLSKLLTPEQTQQAMVILHGLRAEATEKEKQAAVLDLISSAKLSINVECVDNDTQMNRV